jgi:hypothetical protein
VLCRSGKKLLLCRRRLNASLVVQHVELNARMKHSMV